MNAQINQSNIFTAVFKITVVSKTVTKFVRFISFTIFIVYENHFYSLNLLIKYLWIVLVNFFERYSEYSSCLISFLSFCDLFLDRNCSKVIVNLLSV